MQRARAWRHEAAAAGWRGHAVVVAAFVAVVAVGAGCRASDPTREVAPVETSRATSREARPASTPDRPRVVTLGDSLTAGLGLGTDEAYPAVLQQLIDEAGYDVEVVNMGVSGDTSAGGRRRLDWALDGDVRVLVLALGANDGLRGLSPDELAANLEAIVTSARERGIDVLLCGMEAPPNFGPEFTAAFRGVYSDLAARHDLVFLPFLLDGIAGIPSLNQADGIHPNQEGARLMATLVWERLEPMIRARTTS